MTCMIALRRLIIVAAGLCAGCSRTPATTAEQSAPARPAAAPAAAPALAPPAAQTVSGTVLETMDASNYTYVRVKTESRELWAASSPFKVAVGDPIVISLDQPMENFHSQALNRDFPLIYFVSRPGRGGEGAVPPLAVGHAGGDAAPQAPPPTVTSPMTPPAGGTTVATVWKTRTALAGKKVTVRGKVVKYNGGILGVNWIHLQDGTGQAADGSNDITVTSDTQARLGEVITVTGTVAVDKDLGSGYNYPVIIEHAGIVRQ
jgi:hypothetical protein